MEKNSTFHNDRIVNSNTLKYSFIPSSFKALNNEKPNKEVFSSNVTYNNNSSAKPMIRNEKRPLLPRKIHVSDQQLTAVKNSFKNSINENDVKFNVNLPNTNPYKNYNKRNTRITNNNNNVINLNGGINNNFQANIPNFNYCSNLSQNNAENLSSLSNKQNVHVLANIPQSASSYVYNKFNNYNDNNNYTKNANINNAKFNSTTKNEINQNDQIENSKSNDTNESSSYRKTDQNLNEEYESDVSSGPFEANGKENSSGKNLLTISKLINHQNLHAERGSDSMNLIKNILSNENGKLPIILNNILLNGQFQGTNNANFTNNPPTAFNLMFPNAPSNVFINNNINNFNYPAPLNKEDFTINTKTTMFRKNNTTYGNNEMSYNNNNNNRYISNRNFNNKNNYNNRKQFFRKNEGENNNNNNNFNTNSQNNSYSQVPFRFKNNQFRKNSSFNLNYSNNRNNNNNNNLNDVQNNFANHKLYNKQMNTNTNNDYNNYNNGMPASYHSAFNSFNPSNNNNSNHEILVVNVKINNENKIVKLNKYDDFYEIAKSFCIANNLPDKIIKPLSIKLNSALGSINKVFTTKLKKYDVDYLQSLSTLWTDIYNSENCKTSERSPHSGSLDESLEESMTNISSISFIADDQEENKEQITSLNNSF